MHTNLSANASRVALRAAAPPTRLETTLYLSNLFLHILVNLSPIITQPSGYFLAQQHPSRVKKDVERQCSDTQLATAEHCSEFTTLQEKNAFSHKKRRRRFLPSTCHGICHQLKSSKPKQNNVVTGRDARKAGESCSRLHALFYARLSSTPTPNDRQSLFFLLFIPPSRCPEETPSSSS